MSQQDRDTSFMQYRNMQQEQRETPPFKKEIRPAGFRNEDGIERPREIGNYVRLAMNPYPGPTIRGNVGYNSDWEALELVVFPTELVFSVGYFLVVGCTT